VATKKTPAKKAPAKKPAPKKAPAKKPAPKKASAKSAPAKKTAAKKPAPKKAPTKKAVAKKPAAKKTAKKKPPAKAGSAKKPATTAGRTKSPTRKTPPKRAESVTTTPAPDSTVDLPKPKPRKQIKFKVRDKVVYPHHGAAIIIGKEKHSFDGKKQDYFVIEAITNPLTLRIPANRATDLGLRPVISKNAARKVFSILREDPVEADATWARWFKLLQDKMSSGDIFEVASVVRDLTYAQQNKPLGPALKRMLAKARLILTSELQLALNTDEETVVKRLDKSLEHLIVEPEEED
jgi:CarD family transcriptional regulator